MSVPRWIAALGVLLAIPLAAAAVTPLSLAEAERLGLARDLQAATAEARAEARSEQAVAVAALPDPQLRLGAANLPLDSLHLGQEPMTQLQLGLRQRLPPAGTRGHRRERELALAAAQRALAEDARARTLRETRLAWLELWYQRQVLVVLDRHRALFDQLLEISRAHYGAGRGAQTDLLQAELELARLDDRLSRSEAEAAIAQARLARWVGRAASRPLPAAFPELPAVADQARLVAALERHPQVLAATQRSSAGAAEMDLARDRYGPGWTLDLGYGARAGRHPDGNRRADFVTAMISLDLPLFTADRQDRELAASSRRHAASLLERRELRRELTLQLDSEQARWTRLQTRRQLYAGRLGSAAEAHADAALRAYQSGVGDFAAVVRARLTALDTRIEALRVQADLAQTQARLAYLATQGETP